MEQKWSRNRGTVVLASGSRQRLTHVTRVARYCYRGSVQMAATFPPQFDLHCAPQAMPLLASPFQACNHRHWSKVGLSIDAETPQLLSSPPQFPKQNGVSVVIRTRAWRHPTSHTSRAPHHGNRSGLHCSTSDRSAACFAARIANAS
jgi:hypothetical protein